MVSCASVIVSVSCFSDDGFLTAVEAGVVSNTLDQLWPVKQWSRPPIDLFYILLNIIVVFALALTF